MTYSFTPKIRKNILHRSRKYYFSWKNTTLLHRQQNPCSNVEEVDFLGYMVAVDGVTMSERKVQSIRDWKPPQSVKEGQIFIGFANCYWSFINDFLKICKPITETLKGDPRKFSWEPEQNKAFEELKTRFITAPILCHFFPDRQTIVETDASDFAPRCVLSQFKDKRLHPVAFYSQ